MSKLLDTEILGLNIKRIRISRSLTQEQVAAKLQLLGSPISRSTYSLIEMGRGNIFVSDLVALKETFAVSYEELFAGIPTSRKARNRKEKAKQSPAGADVP